MDSVDWNGGMDESLLMVDWTTGLYEHPLPNNNLYLCSGEINQRLYSCRQHCLLNDESAEQREARLQKMSLEH